MLTPELIRYLRSLRRTAVVLLLLHYLDRPAGETEVASSSNSCLSLAISLCSSISSVSKLSS